MTYGLEAQLFIYFQKLDFAFLSEQFPLISSSWSVRDLGVTLDSSLTFGEHTSNLTRYSYFHLRHLRVIRRSVSSSICSTFIHAFICSRIDYWSSLLVGLPKVHPYPIQLFLNTAAKLIALFPRFSHILKLLFVWWPPLAIIFYCIVLSISLALLTAWASQKRYRQHTPLRARIRFKIITLICKAQRSLAPKCLVDAMHCTSSSFSFLYPSTSLFKIIDLTS